MAQTRVNAALEADGAQRLRGGGSIGGVVFIDVGPRGDRLAARSIGGAFNDLGRRRLLATALATARLLRGVAARLPSHHVKPALERGHGQGIMNATIMHAARHAHATSGPSAWGGGWAWGGGGASGI
eukprot:CAMPEP_0119387966 /NCGR_PEP_ID=MMETSP1334-20130426/102920_1 /TAXON_ID=127549 /ORGANISM="Calcidiscus leptoporus, Strain RCC1130" /LENGTH=126 /DNA_ID=CAMNT_0007409823 /DNA_START=144 /DNA_END=525 /DNA_ORIENTATION=+